VNPDCQAYTADDVATLAGLSPRHVRNLVKQNGHVLGVAPIPDVGRRVLFSRVKIDRALGLQIETSVAS
jgi:hypothetical protein